MPRQKVRVGATERRPGVHGEWHPPASPWIPEGANYEGCGGAEAIRPKRDGRVVVGAMTPCLGCGGAEQALRMLVQYTDHARLEWAGVWLSNPASIDPVLADAVRKVCPVIIGGDAIGDLMEACDVIYTWGLMDYGRLFTDKRVKRVVCSHGSDQTFTAAALADSASADCLVAVADSAIQPFPESVRHRVTVIWNAAETARVKPAKTRQETREAWGVTDEHFVYGAHTRFSREKEVHRMVMALPYMPEHYRLVLAGWGLQEQPIRQWAEQVKQTHRLIMPGVARDVGGFLLGLDRYVSTSPSEGCSLALNEALVAGTPAVSTRTGLLKTRPELARLLPDRPAGVQIAHALLADEKEAGETVDRARYAQKYALTYLTEDQYGKRWTDLLTLVAEGVVHK